MLYFVKISGHSMHSGAFSHFCCEILPAMFPKSYIRRLTSDMDKSGRTRHNQLPALHFHWYFPYELCFAAVLRLCHNFLKRCIRHHNIASCSAPDDLIVLPHTFHYILRDFVYIRSRHLFLTAYLSQILFVYTQQVWHSHNKAFLARQTDHRTLLLHDGSFLRNVLPQNIRSDRNLQLQYSALLP